MPKVTEKTPSNIEASNAADEKEPLDAGSVGDPAKWAKTEEGAAMRIVFSGSKDLILTFDTIVQRDTMAGLWQNGVKRGAMIKGGKIKSREGVFYPCDCLYIEAL